MCNLFLNSSLALYQIQIGGKTQYPYHGSRGQRLTSCGDDPDHGTALKGSDISVSPAGIFFKPGSSVADNLMSPEHPYNAAPFGKLIDKRQGKLFISGIGTGKPSKEGLENC